MSITRLISLVAVLFGTMKVCAAANPKEIDAAVQKGAAFLKQQYNGGKGARGDDVADNTGIAAMAGLALLEAGIPIDDPALRTITTGVRNASFGESRTYHIALCILYLDRLGDPADVPIIQMLGIRLLAGQNADGGWTYNCVPDVPAADERALRAALMVTELKAGAKTPPAEGPVEKVNPARPMVVGKLHAAVEKYAAKLATFSGGKGGDDNSNTQFGIIGTWVARRHGVHTDAALERIEKRFLATQTGTGGWPYSGRGQGSPSMTCAGLLGLATAVGLREERRMKAEAHRKPDPAPIPKANPAVPPVPAAKSDDPFFNPPPVPKSDDPFFNPPKEEPKAKEPPKAKELPKPRKAPRLPLDARDIAIEKGLAALAAMLAGDAPAAGKGKNRILMGNTLGDRDFYFLWSLERVSVVFGLEKIGNIDWYDFGAKELLAAQNASGGWGNGARGTIPDTSFAILFLSRSNFVRDLSARVQKDPANTELRAVKLPSDEPPSVAPMPKPPAVVVPAPVVPTPTPVPVPVPTPATLDPKAIATELVIAPDANWETTLAKVRDGKGNAYTQALVIALNHLDGDRRKATRDALAERLTRMNAETLRVLAKAEEAELRRGAVLAMAMKDEKAHIPDLVAALADGEEIVVRAARAGLKSVTGEDFGPAPDATPAERAASIRSWAEWIKKQK
ncbi:MAG: hypothetical protein K8U57_00725 [Planctomycetes bacterium]|nr:hypothetical protein [Planctomycetota bacterium]